MMTTNMIVLFFCKISQIKRKMFLVFFSAVTISEKCPLDTQKAALEIRLNISCMHDSFVNNIFISHRWESLGCFFCCFMRFVRFCFCCASIKVCRIEVVHKHIQIILCAFNPLGMQFQNTKTTDMCFIYFIRFNYIYFMHESVCIFCLP